MGLRKNVRSQLFPGIRHSRISASPKDSTTARGTATIENVAVFLAAVWKDEFFRTEIKLSKNTNSGLMGLRITE